MPSTNSKSRMNSKKFISQSPRETQALAARLIKKGKRIFALQGDLGSGKTTFAQGIARALGIRRRVTSPTFIVINRHKVRSHKVFADLYHIDTYRLKSVRDLRLLGVEAILKDTRNVVVIEWAEKIRRLIPKSACWIRFAHHEDPQKRVITVNG